MKKYGADNLLFLRKHYPEIYRSVMNRTYDQTRYAPDEARNGQPILNIREGDRTMAMYSRYDPELEAARWLASLRLEEEPADNILLFGFGFGYHAAALLKAYPDKKMYIYEPDMDLFLAAIEWMDLRPILANRQIVVFALGSDASVHEQMLLNIFKSSDGGFSFASPPFYRKRYADLIEAFSEQARKTALAYTIDMNTIRHYREEWIDNVFVNAARNLHTRSFRGMKDSCTGVPAVITGSGPSLGMEIDKLRAVRDRIVLIAAGSSIQSLLHHGVEPDLIVSMDAGEPNRRVFEKIEVGHIPFLYVPMIKHSAIRDDRSPYLLHAYFDVDALSHAIMGVGEEDVVLATTTTVTGTAIQAAVWLGCRDILLIGQDFSFPGEQVYAEGVGHMARKSLEKRVSTSDLTVPNVSGGENRTNKSMLNLKVDTEEVMAAFPNVRFFNASPVGAALAHTTPLLLDELPARLGSQPRPDGWFKQLVLEQAEPLSPDRKRAVRRNVERLNKQFGKYEEAFRALEKLLEQVPDLAPERTKTGEIRSWLAEFERIWPDIVDQTVFERVFHYFVTSEFTHAHRHWPAMQAEKTERGMLDKLLYCIGPLVTSIGKLMPICRAGLDHLQRELAEEVGQT